MNHKQPARKWQKNIAISIQNGDTFLGKKQLQKDYFYWIKQSFQWFFSGEEGQIEAENMTIFMLFIYFVKIFWHKIRAEADNLNAPSPFGAQCLYS